ncbi:hypothetical protein RSAG8_06547, partial [Rhizoctonia solani AG-8 WAC10335]
MVVKNSEVKLQYDPKDMQFRKLGNAGLRVPVFSLGGWLTFGGTVKGDPVKEIVKLAFENGINMIDLAESYSKGESEREVGRVLEELGIRRSDLIISSKIFFGQANRKGPNDKGLSRKHVIEGMKEILERLRVDCVDIIFAHRPDPTVPMEEIVRAFNHLIDTGKAFYWGTSEWSARQVEEAYHVAAKLNLIAPIAEQVEYKFVINTLSPSCEILLFLAASVANASSPNTSKHALVFKKVMDVLPRAVGSRRTQSSSRPGLKVYRRKRLKALDKVKELTKFAETELGCSVTVLALAWAASHPNASTVILGASSPEQLLENLKALETLKKFTPEVSDIPNNKHYLSHCTCQIREKINKILDNTPAPEPNLRPL